MVEHRNSKIFYTFDTAYEYKSASNDSDLLLLLHFTLLEIFVELAEAIVI